MIPVSKHESINQISTQLHRLGVIPVCNRHQGEEDLLRSQGEGEYQSVTGPNRRGEGAVVSHPFLCAVEGSDESSFSEGGDPCGVKGRGRTRL